MPEPPAPDALALDQSARELLEVEVAALAAGMGGSEAQDCLGRLAAAVATGSVPADCLTALEQVLSLGLESGRIAGVHGRAADTLARGLYARTPAGRAREEQARTVTRALAALAGATLTHLEVGSDGPGGHRLRIGTDRGEVLLRLDRGGVGVQSVTVGV